MLPNRNDVPTMMMEILFMIKNGLNTEEDILSKINFDRSSLRRGISFLYHFGFVEYEDQSCNLKLPKPVKNFLDDSN